MNVEDLQALPSREDRRVGAILGLAIGDTLGATYEFCSPREAPEGPLEVVGAGWLGLEPGETNDDTALVKAVLTGYGGGPLDLRRVRNEMLSWQNTRACSRCPCPETSILDPRLHSLLRSSSAYPRPGRSGVPESLWRRPLASPGPSFASSRRR